MRATWSGSISFGLVTVPVKVYTATQDTTPSFRQLDEETKSPIRYRKVASSTGEEVPRERIVKGYEVSKGQYVVLSDEEMEALPARSGKAIDVEQFVDASQIDPVYFERPYYLVPDEAGVKAYNVLRDALAAEDKVAIGRVAFRDKEHLAAIRVMNGVLMLHTMRWPEEIKEAEFPELAASPKVSEAEVKMARTLVQGMTDEFDPARFTDSYREAVQELVQRKLEGEEITVPDAPEPEPVADLMKALEASLKHVEEARSAPKKRAKAS
ncbi:MAG TPA: Ku protein [Actinomycetota bacterium]|nr:Ku protein [Actinomycetota bacterium]